MAQTALRIKALSVSIIINVSLKKCSSVHDKHSKETRKKDKILQEQTTLSSANRRRVSHHMRSGIRTT